MDENLVGNVLGSLINKNNDGFGNGGWWIILLMIFFWGGNGNFGRGGNYATQTDIMNGFNNNGLANDIRACERGIASAGYENLAQINNVTNAINAQTSQLGSAIQATANAVNMAACNTNHNIDNLRYEMAQNTCKITTNATENTQRVLDKLCMMESNAKDGVIAGLRSELQAAQLTLGNASQTQNIIQALKPSPVPAYLVGSGTTIA